MTHLRAASLRGGPAFGCSPSLFSKGAPAACWAHLDVKPQSCMAKNFAVCVTGKYLNWAWWHCLVFKEMFFARAGSGVLQLQRKLPISSLRGYSPEVLLTAMLRADCSAQASWTQPRSTSVWLVLQCFPLKKIKEFYHLNILCILSLVCLVLELRCAVTPRYLHGWGRRRAMNSSQSQPNLS